MLCWLSLNDLNVFNVLILEGRISDDDFKPAFEQEVAITNLFDGHPNFVKLLGFSYNPYSMVLHRYAKGNFTSFIYNKSQEHYYQHCALLLNDVLQGLYDLHHNGIVHMDIKVPFTLIVAG